MIYDINFLGYSVYCVCDLLLTYLPTYLPNYAVVFRGSYYTKTRME